MDVDVVVFQALRLVIFVCVFLIITPAYGSVSDSEALLKFKKSLNNAAALSSWNTGTDPCDKRNLWAGVICVNNVVIGLRLRGMGLSGNIDIKALSQISGLRSLTLMKNFFAGPIPEFNQISALKALFISKNQFSGEIPPDFFANFTSMKKVWLSDNKFTSSIPTSLTGLTRIIELHLENNQFSGKIPEFKQETLVSIDLSNNNLQGEIPASLSRFNDSSFKGNPGLCGTRFGKPCHVVNLKNTTNHITNHNNAAKHTSTTANNGTNHISNDTTTSDISVNIAKTGHKFKYASIAMMVVSAVLLALMIIGIIILKRRQEESGTIEADIFEEPSVRGDCGLMGSGELSGQKGYIASSSRRSSEGMGDLVMVNDEKGVFGMADLMKAAAEVLGNGTNSSSYKATMTNGAAVVVKRIKEMDSVGKDVFDVEIRRLGGLRHKNIITPLAYHFRKEEKLVVYEFIPRGSLLYVLHGDRGVTHSELNWPVRLKIIRGIAQGLGFLHEELTSHQVPHGNLQSRNILLDEEYEPRLSGYGLVSLIDASHAAAQSLMAFRSPEALQYNQVSPKSDVYCLGVVILEVVTGKFPVQYLKNGNGGIDVVQWVKSAVSEGRETQVLDPEIADPKCSLEQMRQLLRIGEACTESDPDLRLDLREAIRRIEEIQIDDDDGGGAGETRTSNVMPSLRDGYADQIEEGRVSAVRGGDGVGNSEKRSVSFAVDVTSLN